MATVKEKKDGAIQIKGKMTVINAFSIKKSLIDMAFGGKSVTLDLSGVEEMDSSGFQLLALVRREAGTRRLPFRVSSASRAVMEVIDLFHAGKKFMKGASK